MTNNITLAEIAEKLKQRDRILLICHVRPDGDTLACAFALKSVLEEMGKTIVCTSSDRVADRLSFLCDDAVYLPEELPKDFKPDLVVSVDVASNTMLGNCKELISLAESIKIDHHEALEQFADHNYTIPESASCSEIIFDLINMLTKDMSDRVCELLYAGISFDTGCFKHSNVTEGTHQKASYLISRNVDSALINQKLFGNKTKKEIEALKMAYNNLQFFAEGKIAVTCITNTMREEKGLSEDDVADLAQIPIEIEGVLIGATLKEKGEKPNNYKISMRSRPGTNVGNVCKRLNGGGHVCAAGGLVVANSKEEAIKTVVEAALTEIN
ncbi:MAG: bifunctional oligoribonuclease/PAP phosphatase NrnA [Clostridia bacterium]|nr:bifunctional oligoribonuclease/PAP phosphatase NrnA [Clostridia bacterium]